MAETTPPHKPKTVTPPATGLAANSIGKAYRGRVVVKDITLTVQRGEVVALWDQMVRVRRQVFT